MCFFFNDTATPEIYTLSLHDALPIYGARRRFVHQKSPSQRSPAARCRSEEHTSELQSRQYFACRLLLGKKTSTTNSLTIDCGRAPLSAPDFRPTIPDL